MYVLVVFFMQMSVFQSSLVKVDKNDHIWLDSENVLTFPFDVSGFTFSVPSHLHISMLLHKLEVFQAR